MFYEVIKVRGGFAVQNWSGEIEAAYKSRKHADQFAVGSTNAIFNGAELDNDRRDCALAYLAQRASRPAPAPLAQLEMF